MCWKPCGSASQRPGFCYVRICVGSTVECKLGGSPGAPRGVVSRAAIGMATP